MIGRTFKDIDLGAVRLPREQLDAAAISQEIDWERLRPKLGARGYVGIGLLGVAVYLIWRRP